MYNFDQYISRLIYSQVSQSGYLRQMQGLVGNSNPLVQLYISVPLLYNYKTIPNSSTVFVGIAGFTNLAL